MTRSRVTGDNLLLRYREVRARTEAFAAPLSAEDQLLQSMPACSPVKWHRAHTTWFFETFLLSPRRVAPVNPAYAMLFNSYYETVGPRVARGARGLLSRPSLPDVTAYRRIVDARVAELLSMLDDDLMPSVRPVVELGLAHEEQHQELMHTDLLHAFFQNPTLPRYRELDVAPPSVRSFTTPHRSGAEGETRPDRSGAEGETRPDAGWVEHEGGLVDVGADGESFAFDNEGPRHRVYLAPFAIAARCVTVADYKAFVAAGGYDTHSLWLSDGWDWSRREHVRAPLYCRFEGDTLLQFGLEGERVPRDSEPIRHVSYYEADAIARFLGARLPTEFEWEASRVRERLPAAHADEVWQWTSSAYAPYPGYAPAAGALGEYNGKFMANQMVLRGGSRFTPKSHVRPTYRNFWPADTRFQMTGLRLARSLAPGAPS